MDGLVTNGLKVLKINRYNLSAVKQGTYNMIIVENGNDGFQGFFFAYNQRNTYINVKCVAGSAINFNLYLQSSITTDGYVSTTQQNTTINSSTHTLVPIPFSSNGSACGWIYCSCSYKCDFA